MSNDPVIQIFVLSFYTSLVVKEARQTGHVSLASEKPECYFELGTVKLSSP